MFKYYALAMLSESVLAKADELGLNPSSYNYRALTDPRREGMWLFVVVDTDGYVLNSKILNELSELDDLVLDLTVIR